MFRTFQAKLIYAFQFDLASLPYMCSSQFNSYDNGNGNDDDDDDKSTCASCTVVSIVLAILNTL